MNDRWRDFEGKGRGKTTGLVVRVRKDGTISLNCAAVQALGMPRQVVLRLNPTRPKAFAIQPATEATAAYAYTLSKQLRSNTYTVSSRRFLKHIHYPIGESGVYVAQVEGEMLIIEWSAD